MSAVIEQAKAIRASIVQAAQYAPDDLAIKNHNLYDGWSADSVEYNVNEKVRFHGALYKCRQKHTSQVGWEPEKTPAMWEVIDEVHTGTVTDPIPAAIGMVYEKDKYYSENDVIYLCIRDSEVPLYHMPSVLIDSYFEVTE